MAKNLQQKQLLFSPILPPLTVMAITIAATNFINYQTGTQQLRQSLQKGVRKMLKIAADESVKRSY